ncbi:MAG TPA: Lpp/OprI family alanine-zipper lipoprotein [Aliidongia sp.]|nr:Lpp/OprI family alanine-zipper lipoprotein [Aliidongia sp.]
MKFLRPAFLALVPMTVLGACTTLSDQDRALLTSASQNAEQAKATAQQALAASQAAQSSAASAAQAASQAAADARAANEKADRMFQRSLRKTAPPQ